MAKFHAIWAIGFVLVFLATGRYMRIVFPEAHQGDPTMRMLFRSAHVYILLTALLNAAYALNLRPLPGWRRGVQLLASVMLAAAPVVCLLAFFVEPAPARLDRPYALSGVILAAAGIGLAALPHLPVSKVPRQP